MNRLYHEMLFFRGSDPQDPQVLLKLSVPIPFLWDPRLHAERGFIGIHGFMLSVGERGSRSLSKRFFRALASFLLLAT